MDPGSFALMIPIVAIVGGLGVGVVKAFIRSSERRFELQLMAQQGADQATLQQLEQVKAELARLRDTSTQFDMAIEQSVSRLEHRLSRVEATAGRQPQVEVPETPQILGR